MTIDLTIEDLDALIESVEHSKDKVRNAPGTPYEVRQQKLARLEAVAAKLKHAQRA